MGKQVGELKGKIKGKDVKVLLSTEDWKNSLALSAKGNTNSWKGTCLET